MSVEQELDERVATTLKRLDVTTRESWPWVTTGELEDLIRDLRAELQAAQEREADIHTALTESNVPRSAGVDEPLYSDAYRVRLLGTELRLAQENIRVREESQIPVIPRGAQAKIDRLESELQSAQEREKALWGVRDGVLWLNNNRHNYGSADWLKLFDALVEDALAAQRTEEARDG